MSEKKLLLGFAVLSVVAGVFGGVALADRTDIWLSSSVTVTGVNLAKLPDGGCVVTACGYYRKTDGGESAARCPSAEVTGANRTLCLDIIDSKAPAVFRVAEGL